VLPDGRLQPKVLSAFSKGETFDLRLKDGQQFQVTFKPDMRSVSSTWRVVFAPGNPPLR